jgi:hypothetical protein
VYTSNIGELKVSTSFADWIDQDLLQVEPLEIDAVNLRNYSLDRTTGRVGGGETLLLQKDAKDEWSLYGKTGGEELNLTAIDGLLRNLASLKIVGVLPKPEGITATLRNEVASTTITAEDRQDLGRKGFYLASSGQLVSNRGEMVVRTVRGVYYTLRFGDIAPGTDAPAAETTETATAANPPNAAGPAAQPAPPTPRENRYLFIMVDYDPQSAISPGRAAEGADKSKVLRARFAPWYYVIAANSFSAIQLSRKDLVTPRTSAAR